MEYQQARELAKEFCVKCNSIAKMIVYLGASARLIINLDDDGDIFSIEEEYAYYGDTNPTTCVHNESYLEEMLDDMTDCNGIPLSESDAWHVHLLPRNGKCDDIFWSASTCREYLDELQKN